MGSAIPQGELAEIVREARARTGVPAVAAGLVVDGGVELAADGAAAVDTPFRVASITKWFTASLAADLDVLDARVRALLSHTADLRCESAQLLPGGCRGLWSYSNAGYWEAGDSCVAAAGESFSEAMRARILEPLGLGSTTFDEPAGAVAGHVQAGATGQRPIPTPHYPVERRASGGLWSTAGDLLRFAESRLGTEGPVFEPHARALGAEYCLGCWRRELADGRVAFDHEGSVGGYQSLLLLVPEERAALAILTNSWRGSGLVRRVVKALGLVPASGSPARVEEGTFALDGVSAEVRDGWITQTETDPLAGAPLARRYRVSGNAPLMSHRTDFPREGVARIGWVALPRVDS